MAAGMVGAIVFGAYKLNGEMQPLTDVWNGITSDVDKLTGYSFEQDGGVRNNSIELGTASTECLGGTGAGVVQIDTSPNDGGDVIYLRQANAAEINLSDIQKCFAKAVAKNIPVHLVVVNNNKPVK